MIEAVAPAIYMIIRPEASFWVEWGELGESTTTLQSFRSGCYEGAFCADATGGAWRVIEASLGREPGLLDRVLPWRRLPVELRLGPRRDLSLGELLAHLSTILDRKGDFQDSLTIAPGELLYLLGGAESIGEAIRIVAEHTE